MVTNPTAGTAAKFDPAAYFTNEYELRAFAIGRELCLRGGYTARAARRLLVDAGHVKDINSLSSVVFALSYLDSETRDITIRYSAGHVSWPRNSPARLDGLALICEIESELRS